MTKRPKAPKYRNLHAYRGAIIYERLVNGRRFRANTRTNDWSEAARLRELYEDCRIGTGIALGRHIC